MCLRRACSPALQSLASAAAGSPSASEPEFPPSQNPSSFGKVYAVVNKAAPAENRKTQDPLEILLSA